MVTAPDRPEWDALAQAYDGITAVVAPLDDFGLLAGTGCRGWTVADLLFHLLCDARRALVTLASPSGGPADVDRCGYWRSFPGADPGPTVATLAWALRRSASTLERPTGVVDLWTQTAPAAVRAAQAADPQGHVATQGHVLTVADFLATLVTEAVIHHLDLVVDLPGAPEPTPLATRIAVSSVDGLLSDEAVRPAAWTAAEFLLKAAGRRPLDDQDRRELGEAAGWFPLLG